MRTSKIREFNVRGSYRNGYNVSVYTKRFSVRPKLSGLGFFGEDAPFTYTPPAGWTAASTTQVTAGNQDQLAMDGPDVSDNRFPSEAVDVSGRFAPPVGWWVIIIQSTDGQQSSVVWLNPGSGAVYNIDNLSTGAGTASMTPRGTPSDTATPGTSSIGFGAIALAAGVGYVVYKLFIKGPKQTSRLSRAHG